MSEKGRAMPWVWLLLAGVFEIGWAVGLKYTHGFTKLWPSVLTIAAMVLSMALLGRAVRDLPLGTAYAIWTGIGTIGTAIIGIDVLREPATALRLACLVMIVAGIVGLKLLSANAASGAASTP
jgi:quaternary ammonium compound-resistance protein SugE